MLCVLGSTMAMMRMALWICLLQAIAVMSADPDALQDFCVADVSKGAPTMNGYACLNPSQAKPEHFLTSALNKIDNSSTNRFGLTAKSLSVEDLPGMNTQGLTLQRTELTVGGMVFPHSHPRATEMVFVMQGTLLCGFVDTTRKHFSWQAKTGDVFVFPKGLLHYVQNVGNTPVSVIVAFNSQNPGISFGPLATFRSNPPISDKLLASSFRISTGEVARIRNNLSN